MKLTTDRKTNSEDRNESQMSAHDRILTGEEKLVPSSGFLAAVMERVREEAAAPAPIPFPWKHIAPGLVPAVGTIGWGAWLAARFAWPAMHEFAENPPEIPATVLLHLEQAGWVALALAVSWGGWALSMWMVQRSELL